MKEVITMSTPQKMMSIIFAVIFALSMADDFAIAADYPTKPITLVASSAPGGSVDILARIFGSVAEPYIGQPFVMAYKPGAGHMIGAQEVANAKPDGYTLLLDASAITSGMEWEIANGRKPVVTRDDFVAIGSWTKSPTVVLVPQNSPWNTLADMIKDLKAKPSHYAFCSGGMYGGTHPPVELLLSTIGAKARHVPYQGGGPCLIALTGGHVDFACQFPSSSIPLIRGNKLRALAVQADKRLKSLPEVPTCKELGVNAEYYMWVGLTVPQKTPMPVVEKLRDVFKKVVEDKTFIDRVEKAGDEVRPMLGDELTEFRKSEAAMYADLFSRLIKEKQ
jgi:tripartite-type tricarboxylate transporter receptor subunit TctC